jgi:hypothetical protein
MNRIKLLQDLPGGVEAGTIFVKTDSRGWFQESEPTITGSLKNLVKQLCHDTAWFEDISLPEFKRERALKGNIFYTVSPQLEPIRCVDNFDARSNSLYSIGNYFMTEEEAEAAAKSMSDALTSIWDGAEQDFKEGNAEV